jgi:hypothetical protein
VGDELQVSIGSGELERSTAPGTRLPVDCASSFPSDRQGSKLLYGAN